MPTLMQGDFSAYPSPVREIYPYILGEVCELHALWESYRHLFMDDAVRTQQFGMHLGGVGGYFQALLQDEMLLSICRLTDKGGVVQQNLSFPSLCDACSQWDPELGLDLAPKLQALETQVRSIRQHRHKRLAHYDLKVSIGSNALPVVTLQQMREAIEQMEQILQPIAWRGEGTTIMFDVLDHRDITTAAEIAVAKAACYDAMVEQGKVEWSEWRRHLAGAKANS